MTRHLAALLLAATLVACGGETTGPDPIPGLNNGTMSARIDGANWSTVGVTAITTQGSPTIISIAGTNMPFTVSMAWVDSGPRTYTIGQSIGLNASLIDGSNAWTAAGQQGSGSVTVTTRTAERVAGTFSYSMAASGSGTAGPRSVTNGTFDIRF